MKNRLKRNYSINSSRVYLARFAQRAAASIPDNSHVLDAGAGDNPYRSFFSHVRYDSTDFCQVEKKYGHLSYICNLEKISVKSDTYDLIFCTQTLEHVAEPKSVLSELYRILKPGGHLWLTAPLFYPEHEIPYDFYRYTQYGLKHLINGADFQIESIEWLEGYFGTLAFQMKAAAKALPMKIDELKLGLLSLPVICFMGVLKIIFMMLSVFFTWLDLRIKYVTGGQCKNYEVIAKKVT